MRKPLITTISVILIAMIASGGPISVSTRSEEREKENIEDIVGYLLDYILKSNSVFIRNGREYTADKAADHIRKKYVHYRDEIESPEDFIRLAATKSMMSGKPYQVKLEDGRKILCADWLTEALTEYRARADSLDKAVAEPDSADRSD